LEIQDGRQGLIFDKKMTILPVDHHGDHKVGPIVFILGDNIAILCHHDDQRQNCNFFIKNEPLVAILYF
jgi:hypothetical protein